MLNVEQFGGKNRAREEREKIKTPKKKKTALQRLFTGKSAHLL
jgi:hypothetical protein